MDWEKYFTSPRFLMGANLLANSTYDPMKQDKWGAFGAGLAGGANSIAEMQKIRAAQNKERKIVRGADGYNYYADTMERVLPGVQLKPTKENERFTNFQIGSDGNTYAFDRVEQKVVKLPGATMPAELGEGKDRYYNVTTNPITGKTTGINRDTSQLEVIGGVSRTPTQLPLGRTMGHGQTLYGPDNKPIISTPDAPYSLGPGQARYSPQGEVVTEKPQAPLRSQVMIDGQPGQLISGVPYFTQPDGTLKRAPDGSQVTTLPRLQGTKEDLGLTGTQRGDALQEVTKLEGAVEELSGVLAAIDENPTSLGIPGVMQEGWNAVIGTIDAVFDSNMYEQGQMGANPQVDEARAKMRIVVGKLVQPITGDTSGRYSEGDMQRVNEAYQALLTTTHKGAAKTHVATIMEVMERNLKQQQELYSGEAARKASGTSNLRSKYSDILD